MTTVPATPTAGLLCSVVTAPWIDTAPTGERAAFILIASSSSRQNDGTAIEARMLGLAGALDLAPSGETIPRMNRPLTIHGGKAILSITGCDYHLGAPVGPQWEHFVTTGGPVVVALGLAPLTPGASRDAVEAYIGRCALTGGLFTGLTRYTTPGNLS